MKKTGFQKLVYEHYSIHGRHSLPWRKTKNPYRILVSEVMLQQTQVSRALPKYKIFLTEFPTLSSLAQAPLRDVLQVWQGLGYNRRAKYLHTLAKTLCEPKSCTLPKKIEHLTSLPGIGPYTAGAICVFAYNQAVPLLETNIRTVYIHYFFPHRKKVSESEIKETAERMLDHKTPREWNWALMDLGAHLKQQKNISHRKSKNYKKQSAFKGSAREVRGMIVRELSKTKSLTLGELCKRGNFSKERVESQLKTLQNEKLIQKVGKSGWSL